MGKRKVVVRESAAHLIAEVGFFIESKGIIATAEKFSDSVYDCIEQLSNDLISHADCRDIKRKALGTKCKTFRKK